MNPAVVDQTANVPDAAKKIVWGAMAWAARVHVPGYAYVHESIAGAFASPEAKKALLELFGKIRNPIRTIPASSTHARWSGWPHSLTPPR